MKPLTLILTVILFMSTAKHSIGQSIKRDTSEIVMPGFDKYKKDRNSGKVLQILGGLALTGYFVMAKRYENSVLDGETNSTPPPGVLPIVGSGLMTVGFGIDMGAVEHLFKRKKKKKTVRISTENYQF